MTASDRNREDADDLRQIIDSNLLDDWWEKLEEDLDDA